MEKKATETKRIVIACVRDSDEIYPAPGLGFHAEEIDDFESLAGIGGLILQSREQGEALIETYRDKLTKLVSERVDEAKKNLDQCFANIENDNETTNTQ